MIPENVEEITSTTKLRKYYPNYHELEQTVPHTFRMIEKEPSNTLLVPTFQKQKSIGSSTSKPVPSDAMRSTLQTNNLFNSTQPEKKIQRPASNERLNADDNKNNLGSGNMTKSVSYLKQARSVHSILTGSDDM